MRADCSPPSGCHRCGGVLSGRRRAYCSEACRDEHYENHNWNMAAWAALNRVRKLSGYGCEGSGPHRGRTEVHHLEPLRNGQQYGTWTCKHHQDGLTVLCKNCHITVHKKLRGTYRPERQTAKQGVLL